MSSAVAVRIEQGIARVERVEDILILYLVEVIDSVAIGIAGRVFGDGQHTNECTHRNSRIRIG